jgi:DNA polymerase-3 subunit gamma/tau
MSYLVLARKWRPQTFAEVVGQTHIVQTLQNAIKFNRIPHALLFCGPRGVGKTTVARILAKALNCEKGPSIEPCNECISCQEITQGHSLDVYEMDGASNRGIDEIREIRENVRYLPSKGRYKVYIIDEVHMLTKEAFNALLKTLEEPPPHVIFIFATTEPHKIPATIISRCQRFPFKRIASKTLYERLKYITSQEQIEIEDEALWLLVRAAAGGLRDALSLLDQVISFSTPPIKAEDIRAILGLFDTQIVFEVIEAILDQDIKRTVFLIAKIAEEGEDIKEFYYQLVTYWRHLLMVKINPETSLVDLPDNEVAQLKLLSQKQPLSRLEQFFQLLLNEEGNIRLSTQPRFVLESLLIKLSDFARLVPIEVILERIGQLKDIPRTSLSQDYSSTPQTKTKEVASISPEAKEQKISTTEVSLSPQPNPIKDKLLKIFKRECPLIAATLENAVLIWQNGTLKLRLPKLHADLIKKVLWKIFEKHCKECLKKDCQIVIEATNGRVLPEISQMQREKKEFNLLKEVLQIFGGEVVYFESKEERK